MRATATNKEYLVIGGITTIFKVTVTATVNGSIKSSVIVDDDGEPEGNGWSMKKTDITEHSAGTSTWDSSWGAQVSGLKHNYKVVQTISLKETWHRE